MRELIGVGAVALVLALAGCGLSEDEKGRSEEAPAKAAFAIEGPPILGLREELKARLPTQADQFGVALAASGSTLLVGGSEEAHVFVRGSSGYFNFQQRLVTDEAYPASLDSFGTSVALSGDTALVGCVACRGASGAAFVFVRSNEKWLLQQTLTASDAKGEDNFGRAVALDGNSALVTAAGGAYVFDRVGDAWTQQVKLELEGLGTAAAVSADAAAVVLDSVGLRGVTYGFTRSVGVWSPKTLLASGTTQGGVAFSGNLLAVTRAGRGYLVGPPTHGSLTLLTATPPLPPESPNQVWQHGGPGVAFSGDQMFLGSDVGDSGTAGTLYLKSNGIFVKVADVTSLNTPNVVAMGDNFVALGYGYRTTWASGKVSVLTTYREPQLACSVNSECVSGNCVNGVCCDTACNDNPCRSCLAAVKGQGQDGVCDWIAAETQTTCHATVCGSAEPSMLEPSEAVKSYQCEGPRGCVASDVGCGRYLCDRETVSCRDSCNVTAECKNHSILGFVCFDNRCVQEGEPGYPSTGGQPSTNGGTPGMGGTATGGTASGGTGAGGDSNGGDSNGGDSNGGDSNGGDSNGGESVGGEVTSGGAGPSRGGSVAATGGSSAAAGGSAGRTPVSESGGRASGGQRPGAGGSAGGTVHEATGGKATSNAGGGCSLSAAPVSHGERFGVVGLAAALCFAARRRHGRRQLGGRLWHSR